MVKLEGVKFEAVYGCVPSGRVDNLAACTKLFGPKKAEAVVKATGFATRAVAAAGTTVVDLALPAARAALAGVDPATVGGVVFVSFSAPDRFPAAAITAQHALGLPSSVFAFDVDMACSGYPYGLLLAGQLVHATGKRVLLLDGDIQTAHVDPADPATVPVMSDAATATLLAPSSRRPETAEPWNFDFLTDGSGRGALDLPDGGHIRMDGFAVFSFVAGPVAKFLAGFLATVGAGPDVFVPHQANLYMVRQLAKSLKIAEDRLWISGDRYANPGSCSVPLTIAARTSEPPPGARVLLAAFGAGLSAAAALVTLGDCRRGIVEFPEPTK